MEVRRWHQQEVPRRGPAQERAGAAESRSRGGNDPDEGALYLQAEAQKARLQDLVDENRSLSSVQ